MLNSYDRLKYRRDDIKSLFYGRVLGHSRQLKKLITDYPIYSPPHPGPSQKLSAAQAEQNYGHFEQEKSNRLTVVGEMLEYFKITVNTQIPEKHCLMLLDAWAYQQWEGIFIPSLAKSDIYNFPTSGIEAQIRSMLFDISILLGECYLSLNHQSEWLLDISNQSKDDEMPSLNRIIINNKSSHTRDYIDMEAHVFFHYGSQKLNPALIEADQKIGRTLAEPVILLL